MDAAADHGVFGTAAIDRATRVGREVSAHGLNEGVAPEGFSLTGLVKIRSASVVILVQEKGEVEAGLADAALLGANGGMGEVTVATVQIHPVRSEALVGDEAGGIETREDPHFPIGIGSLFQPA